MGGRARARSSTRGPTTASSPAPSSTSRSATGSSSALHNDLPLATDLHLHGLNVANEFDGVAPITQDPIEPGETFTYEYVADECRGGDVPPAPHGQMGLPNGMFGTIFVGDVPLPRGRPSAAEEIPADLEVSQEFPMVLNDAGVIGYSLNGKSFPATAPIVANRGDWVVFHYFNEGTQIHPMHLHQFDQIVLAKDGYPLDQPYVVDTLNVAPGERYTGAGQPRRAGHLGLALPHPPPRRAGGRHVRHGHRHHRRVATFSSRVSCSPPAHGRGFGLELVAELAGGRCRPAHGCAPGPCGPASRRRRTR